MVNYTHCVKYRFINLFVGANLCVRPLYQINVAMPQIFYMNKFLFKENIVILRCTEESKR